MFCSTPYSARPLSEKPVQGATRRARRRRRCRWLTRCTYSAKTLCVMVNVSRPSLRAAQFQREKKMFRQAEESTRMTEEVEQVWANIAKVEGRCMHVGGREEVTKTIRCFFWPMTRERGICGRMSTTGGFGEAAERTARTASLSSDAKIQGFLIASLLSSTPPYNAQDLGIWETG